MPRTGMSKACRAHLKWMCAAHMYMPYTVRYTECRNSHHTWRYVVFSRGSAAPNTHAVLWRQPRSAAVQLMDRAASRITSSSGQEQG
jgi:hypothetical protein